MGFPEEIGSREFGYIPFGGTMVRHLSFKSPGEAIAEVVRQSPSSVYCSNARYESPSLPIEEKGWKGAELIFDIDATDIQTPCKKGHDLWFCAKCHAEGRLPRPRNCPKCHSSTEEFHTTCSVCLAAAKDHTLRLTGFLVDDFGVQAEMIKLYFSGNRGYHIHVFDDRFYLLNQAGRAEIADYVRGGSLPATQTIASILKRRPSEEQNTSLGWMKRIEFYASSQRQRTATLQKLASEAISSSRSLVDASVTTDVHRVFRLAGTLHGTTGMCKTPVESPSSFNPDTDPVVLSSSTVELQVDYCPEFRIGGRPFGPYAASRESLPTYAAIQILARGMGEVAR